jgi:DNA repair exonuclease SbcCD ATPase subunit
MQIYAIRYFNFFRFSENNNSVVFDILPEDQLLLNGKEITLDQIYDRILENPVDYVGKVKEKGLTNLISISGVIGENYDVSNGAGKSTILEGICYAHYEQVVRRNANTDKVAPAGLSVVTKIDGKYPPKMRESWVEEIFEESGKIYRIKRGRTFTAKQTSSSPILEFVCYNESEEDSRAGHRKADTNESIAQVTSMDYDLFVNSVLFGQMDHGRFLTSSDKTRKEMLIGLLKLEGIINGCLENVRRRKNAKEKDINSLNAQIDIVDNNLKSKESVESMEAKINEYRERIKLIETEIGNYNNKIEELSKSDAIKVVESIKQEGKKIQDNLKAQKEIKESQIKEWTNLWNETERKEKDLDTKMQNLVAKQKQIQNQIDSLESDIKTFDMAAREEILKKVEKAREYKPKLIASIGALQIEKEKNVASLASDRSENNGITKEIQLLQSQLNNAKTDEFICDKCKSKVNKKHIIDEITRNSDINYPLGEKIKELEQRQNEITVKLNNTQSNLDKANEFLIKENKVKSEIRDNENKKQKLEEIKKMQSEDYGKMLNDMEIEQKALIKQKEGYVSKSNEISKKYDSDINKMQTQLNEIGVKYTNTKKDAENIENTVKSFRDKISASTQNKSQCDSQIGALNKSIEHIGEETTKLKKLREKHIEETALLNRLEVLDGIFGLEGIQTRIIKKYLPLLNNYIKEILDVLTNGEMRVNVFINDKSKVDILIEGGTSDTFVQLSGGEKTLCRLGCSIGLAFLSYCRCNSRPHLICLDEIFSSLDVSHEDAAFRLIKKLQEKFSRILIISHRASINDRIEHKIVVEKELGICGISKIKEII